MSPPLHRHLTEELRLQQRYITGDALTVVQNSVARNALMAHPESILLAMLGDDDQQIRAAAVSKIATSR